MRVSLHSFSGVASVAVAALPSPPVRAGGVPLLPTPYGREGKQGGKQGGLGRAEQNWWGSPPVGTPLQGGEAGRGGMHSHLYIL